MRGLLKWLSAAWSALSAWSAWSLRTDSLMRCWYAQQKGMIVQ